MKDPVRAYASRRFAILFYSLLISVAAVPLLEALRLDAELLELFLALNLIAGVLGLEAGGSDDRLRGDSRARFRYHSTTL